MTGKKKTYFKWVTKLVNALHLLKASRRTALRKKPIKETTKHRNWSIIRENKPNHQKLVTKITLQNTKQERQTNKNKYGSWRWVPLNKRQWRHNNMQAGKANKNSRLTVSLHISLSVWAQSPPWRFQVCLKMEEEKGQLYPAAPSAQISPLDQLHYTVHHYAGTPHCSSDWR